MRKRAEVENTGKNEATGPRKPKDILGNRVSVKVSRYLWTWVPLIHSFPEALSQAVWVGGDWLLIYLLPCVGTKGEVV